MKITQQKGTISFYPILEEVWQGKAKKIHKVDFFICIINGKLILGSFEEEGLEIWQLKITL